MHAREDEKLSESTQGWNHIFFSTGGIYIFFLLAEPLQRLDTKKPMLKYRASILLVSIKCSLFIDHINLG
jgi:predicted tellurium resistance membrane protein TerC